MKYCYRFAVGVLLLFALCALLSCKGIDAVTGQGDEIGQAEKDAPMPDIVMSGGYRVCGSLPEPSGALPLLDIAEHDGKYCFGGIEYLPYEESASTPWAYWAFDLDGFEAIGRLENGLVVYTAIGLPTRDLIILEKGSAEGAAEITCLVSQESEILALELYEFDDFEFRGLKGVPDCGDLNTVPESLRGEWTEDELTAYVASIWEYHTSDEYGDYPPGGVLDGDDEDFLYCTLSLTSGRCSAAVYCIKYCYYLPADTACQWSLHIDNIVCDNLIAIELDNK